MKTNQVMVRPMGNFKVLQRTKDGMFNATDLVKQWNIANNAQKQIIHYTENKSTEEYVSTIMARETKQRNSVILSSRGKNGGTWMHPMLFLDFAMWLNPSFKYDVIKFVQDQMIAYRNEAGDAYRELSGAVQSLEGQENMPTRMKFVAKALNYLTFGQSEPAIRNSFGTENSQKQLLQRERHITDLIKEGFVRTFDQLQTYLRKCWVREKL